MNSLVKNILPPFLYHFYLRNLKQNKYGWFGDFSSWQQALTNTKGYDAENILEKVKEATLKVKSGEVVYERDSVLFDKIEYSWPLVSALLLTAVKQKGRLNMIDFGGSLGSSYFQNRKFLDTMETVNWNVVEQGNFVSCGKQFIQDKALQFFETVDASIEKNGLPGLMLLSCTLPYIEQPYSLLEYLVTKQVPYFMIDNTPFNNVHKDRLAIQKVNPAIYEASYPCWFLEYDKVKAVVEKKYTILSEHTNDSIIALDGEPVQYRGFLAELK